jgi:prepilin-type N-terminal cleavage/methylation domain-containing protein
MIRTLQTRTSRQAFTLVELLVVMALIAVLAGLTLGVSNGVQTNAKRSRAKTEIAAMSTALERYKSDNGLYPLYDQNGSGLPDPVTDFDSSSTTYLNTAKTVFVSLAARTNWTDLPSGPVYMEFKKNQISSVNNSAVADPWKRPYGYFYTTNTTQTTKGYSGAGFFDLWSTGDPSNTATTNQWINNWRPN